jgi:hypothetical protein
MSFDEKLSNYFSNFSLLFGSKPTENLVYLYADYVELLTLFSNGSFVTSSDVLDRFEDEGLLNLKVKISEEDYEDKDEDRAEVNDKYEIFMDGVFRLVNERSNLFRGDYPFLVGNDKLILIENEEISERQKIYIFLLLASSLNIFLLFKPELTKEFEILCSEVLKNFLPNHAVVKSFGKNSDYQGSAVEKIRSLAADLKITIDEDGFGEISKKGNQDKGLDLIGWIPFEDTVPNFLAILGQCACGKDWNKKLNETTRFENYMRFHRLKPTHSMFVPYSLANFTKPVFFRNDEITNHLIFERKRILNYLSDLTFFENLESRALVNRCIEYEEGLV